MELASLAYRLLIGMFLPGCIGFTAVYLNYEKVQTYINKSILCNEPSFLLFLSLCTSCLIIGYFIEGFRYITIDMILNRIFYGKKSPKYSKEMRTETDIKFYDLVYDTSYAPYQFYSNSSIALLTLLTQFGLNPKIELSQFELSLIIGIIIVLTAAAVRATYGASIRIKSKFKP